MSDSWRNAKVLQQSGVLTLIIFLGLAGSTARATLLAYDGFDYTGTAIDGMNGGFGFAAGWSDGDADFLHLSNDGVSLISSAYSFAPVGSRIAGRGGEVYRIFDNPIDMNLEQTIYFSMLLRRDSTAASNQIVQISLSTDAGTLRHRMAMANGTQFFVDTVTGAQFGAEITSGETFLLVSKLVTHATGTPDESYIKVYGPSETAESSETVTWTASDTGETLSYCTRLHITLGTDANFTGMVDEIRIGTTWEDVVQVAASFHPGDANGDGMVNLADLQILGDNWQSTSAAWSEADFTGDNIVNLADLQIIGDNWGFGTSPDVGFDQARELAGVIIPEPVSLLLTCGGLLSLFYKRTRH